MKLVALFAALVAVVPALAAPAVGSRQDTVFTEPITVVLNSNKGGIFIDRTVDGARATPKLNVDPSDPKEQWRYAYEFTTDSRDFSWNNETHSNQVSALVATDICQPS